MSRTTTRMLATIVAGGVSQSEIARWYDTTPSKISRVISGEISATSLQLNPLYNDDFPVIDSLLISGEERFQASDIKIDNPKQAANIAESLYMAAEQQSGIKKAITLRHATQLEFSASVCIEFDSDHGEQVEINEATLLNATSKMREIEDLVLPARRAMMRFANRQNEAAAQFLIEIGRSNGNGIPQDSVVPDAFGILFEDLLQIEHNRNEDIEMARRILLLLAGCDFIESLVEAGRSDETSRVLASMIQFYGESRADNIARFVYWNAWERNRLAIKDALKVSVAA